MNSFNTKIINLFVISLVAVPTGCDEAEFQNQNSEVIDAEDYVKAACDVGRNGAPVLGLATGTPACDLRALDIEEDLQVAQGKGESTDHQYPAIEEFDLAANMTPATGPQGKCCKAICSWNPGVWHQLPWNVTQDCNGWARYYCGYYNLVDAQWRTCG